MQLKAFGETREKEMLLSAPGTDFRLQLSSSLLLGRGPLHQPQDSHIKVGPPRAVMQSPSGESQGRQVLGWVAKQLSPPKKFLLFYTSRAGRGLGQC